MVHILPSQNNWLNTGRQIGEGATSSYMDSADQNAIQSSISALGENASARDILDAITNSKTYSPKAKQQVLENYLGAEKFDELKRHAKKTEEIQVEKNRISAEKNSLNKDEKKAAQKVAHGYSALRKIQTMKDIGAKGNLGRGAGVRSFFGGEAAKDFGKYERLGKSLIQDASSIIIRNQKEFDVLAGDLFDPSIPDSKREGILEAMEEIIKEAIEESKLESQTSDLITQENQAPQGKVRVRSKSTGKVGLVTPYEGMDAKYDRI